MRNLKRALSLALASVMLLGMMVVGTSAASYTDVDDKDNVEAIEVLNAVEVMIGRQGNFEPDEAVNRHEMAVIMAKLYLGVETADNYVGSHPFTDVVPWADKYVAACYENGLVAGTSATTYGGGSPLTAVQAAAMMLRALGYENLSKGATNWSTPVTAKANEIRLFAGVASSPKEQLTRNQVAQLALNTLQSTMVTAKGGNDIQIGDVVIPDEMEYTFRVAEKASVGTAIDTKYQLATSAGGATSYTLELGEHLYNGDLRKAETTDDFGRPATRWTYKTNEIGVYVDSSSVYKSWTAKVAKNELYDLLGGGNVSRLTLKSSPLASGDKDKLVVYVDGAIDASKPVKEYIDRDNTGASGGYAGKGVLTEVFQDNNNNVTLSFTNTYLMQATADYSESNKSVRVTVLTSPKNQTVSVNVLKSEDFSGLEGIKEDDYILYTYAKGDIQSGQVATVATGEVTAFSVATGKTFGDAGGSVTLDGTKRDYAKYAEVDATNGCAVEYKLGANASIVLDAYDYVIYVDDSSLSVGNYVYVNAIAPQSGLANKFLADAFFTDGTRDSIVIKEMKASKSGANLLSSSITTRVGATDAVPGSAMIVGGWYAYSKNSSNEYSLVKAQNTAAFRTDGTASTTDKSLAIDNNKVSIGKKDSGVATAAITSVAGDKNTIFVVWGKNNKVTVYTGVANVPDVTQANGYTSWYLRNKDTAGKNASAVFIDATSGSVRNGNSDLLYLLNLDGSEKNTGNATEDTVYTWNVVMVKDGAVEKTQIKTTDGNWAKQIAYKSYGIDSNDFYDLNNTTDKLTHTYPTGDDVMVENIPAAEIDCDGETFTWGGNSLIVNADSVKATALVVYPNKDKNASNAALLRSEVNMDEDASYKVYTNWSGKQIANLFRDWNATGAIYAVLDAKTDRVKSMIVVVDGISTTSGGSGSGGSTTVPGTGIEVNTNAILPINSTATDIASAFADYDVVQVGTATDGAYSVPTGGIVIPANKTLYFPKGVTETASQEIRFYNNSKLISGGKVTLVQDLPGVATVETASLEIASGKNINGTATVTGETEFKGNTTVNGKLTTDSVKGTSSTVTVKGDMTVKGEKVQNGQSTTTGVTYVVLSDSSLHFTCDVPSATLIIVGDNTKANNGRVTITGKMAGTVVVQNKDSAKVDVELADVAADSSIIVKTATSSVVVSGEMGTKKIAVAAGGTIKVKQAEKAVAGLFVDTTTSETVKVSGEYTIGDADVTENITVGTPGNVVATDGTASVTPLAEAKVTVDNGVKTSKIELSPRIIMNEADYRNAITAGVRLTQNVIEWTNLDPHGAATFPWLNIGIKLKDGESLASNTKVTLTIKDEENNELAFAANDNNGTAASNATPNIETFSSGLGTQSNTKTDAYFHFEMVKSNSKNANFVLPTANATAAEISAYMLKDHTFTISAKVEVPDAQDANKMVELKAPEEAKVEYIAPKIVVQPTDVTYLGSQPAQGAQALPTGIQEFTVEGNTIKVTKSYTMNQKVTSGGTTTDSTNDYDDYTFAGLKICAATGGWFKPADGYTNFIIAEFVPVAGKTSGKLTTAKLSTTGNPNGSSTFDTAQDGTYFIFAWNSTTGATNCPVVASWKGATQIQDYGTEWTILMDTSADN